MATTTTARVESRATVRHLGVSPNKVRPVLDLIRRLPAEDAERLLQLQPRTAAGHMLKLLESAIANAEHNQEIPIDELFVDRCWCDEGPTRKWGQARARGRYFRVRKRSSHATIVLARYSDDELRARRGRDDSSGPGSAGGRLARRRADRVRASRAAARGETLEEHDHDHEDHDHEEHDHDGDVVTPEVSAEPASDEAGVDETLADANESDAAEAVTQKADDGAEHGSEDTDAAPDSERGNEASE
jgi:large subunit ribosomal protein L22